MIGLLFATMLIRVALIWNQWGFDDVSAYLGAAHRLRDGEPLYLGSIDPDSYLVFRYSPWFAWLWVPLSYLPTGLVTWGWGAVLAGSSAAVLYGLAKLRQPAAWALALILTPWLLSLVQVGNIQPLIVAMLAFGMSRRSGPLWIAIAASLKGVPLLFGLVYLARRERTRIAFTLAITAILLAPLLLYDLSGYQTDPGRSFSFFYYLSPIAWAIAAGIAAAVAVWFALRRSMYVWVACAIAVMLLAPRTHVTYATYLVVGLLGSNSGKVGDRVGKG